MTAGPEFESVASPGENAHRIDRMEEQYVTLEQLDERCRGCHVVENLKHDDSTNAINRLAGVIEKVEKRWEAAVQKFEEKIETYVPPAVHWVGEIKSLALGFLTATVTFMLGIILYLVNH